MLYKNPHGPSCPWYEITETTGAPNLKWCEETLCQWISEPANTWSNLSYMIAAVAVMYLAHKNHHNKRLKQFGPILFFTGACSFFYHQSNFYLSQVGDFVGMFAFAGWAVGMNLIRMGKLKPIHLNRFNLTLGAFCIGLVHVMYVMNLKFQVLMVVLAIAIVGTEFMIKKVEGLHHKWFKISLLTLTVAFGFSFSDVSRLWCDPTQHGWFSQGHAWWHWIAGLGLFFTYLHYAQPALKPQK